ncbi:CHAT domain-containing protein [Streptomyces sp. WI03-4A]|uniref:CHAT domain-containing protein n=1 Tax=Streptomyces sp. WI03-4A TaxID=3028706 RepID=UPI0029B3340C|nr:CHAT domain-containing protein [Streptomyces sp. WI03-4A]MDX2591743.1 CHAT domain-containing protein [Streptomyces sp. WI03-4A]
MDEAHVVELTLSETEVLVGEEGEERWTASVTLHRPRHQVTVSGRGAGEDLGALTADFRKSVGSQTIGRALRALLLPAEVETAFQDAYLDAVRADALLYVRIRCVDPRFAGLPWELTRTRLPVSASAQQFRQVQLVGDPVRCVLSRASEHDIAPARKVPLRSLVASAADALEHSRPDDEFDWSLHTASAAEQLLERLGRSSLLAAATRQQLMEQLKTTAHVVCVIAHGWDRPATGGVRDCGIVLNGDPEEDYLAAAELAEMLARSGTQLVVLISCGTAGTGDGFRGWGSTADHLIASGIPAVVAMQAPVEHEIGQNFLVGLVAGLTRDGEIHAAMAEGLREIVETSDIVGHLGVPALYTARNGLRLRDAPPAPVLGPLRAYPVVPAQETGEPTLGTEGRRVQLDTVWVLERRPFAGVLLDGLGHDLAQDLNRAERALDPPLKRAGLPARQWFATDLRQPPPQRATWEPAAARTEGEWNDFRDKYDWPAREAGTGTAAERKPKDPPSKREAVDGWVLRVHLPVQLDDAWRRAREAWLERLTGGSGGRARPFVVVLEGSVADLEAHGPAALNGVRRDLEDRLGIPVTALSRHRPGDRSQARGAEAGTAASEGRPGTTETDLRALRRQDPARYARELERLAADETLPGHRESLTVAADYDEDVHAWIRALGANRPVPRPGALPLGIDTERADTIALALLKVRQPLLDADLRAWDDLILSCPVRRLVRRYGTKWAVDPPDEGQLVSWLSDHPDSAPAAVRAGLPVPIGKVLSRLPRATAWWPLLRATDLDREAVSLLLRLPVTERHALGLVRAEPTPAGVEAGDLVEHIRESVGRAPTRLRHPAPTDEATR